MRIILLAIMWEGAKAQQQFVGTRHRIIADAIQRSERKWNLLLIGILLLLRMDVCGEASALFFCVIADAMVSGGFDV